MQGKWENLFYLFNFILCHHNQVSCASKFEPYNKKLYPLQKYPWHGCLARLCVAFESVPFSLGRFTGRMEATILGGSSLPGICPGSGFGVVFGLEQLDAWQMKANSTNRIELRNFIFSCSDFWNWWFDLIIAALNRLKNIKEGWTWKII